MSAIEESIQVHAPLRAVYDQWTRFEQFPTFMEGIEEVRQLDDTHLHWVAAFGGQRHEWDAEVSEQLPDERIAWKNTDGKDNAGVVTFHRIDNEQTRVMVQMDFVPEGIVEKLGTAIGVPDRRVKGDLARFKELIESSDRSADGWRGEVKRPDQRPLEDTHEHPGSIGDSREHSAPLGDSREHSAPLGDTHEHSDA